MKWLRWYHGCATDPKFGRIARRASATRERVVFVWAMILEDASQRDDRDGSFGIAADDIADVLNCDTDEIAAILDQMADAGMIDGGRVPKWSDRQPASDNEARRKQRQRQNAPKTADKPKVDRDCPNDVPGHDRESPALDTDTENTDANASDAAASDEEPLDAQLFGPVAKRIASDSGRPIHSVKSKIGAWKRDHGADATLSAARAAYRSGATEPIAYIERILRDRANGSKKRGRHAGTVDDDRAAILAGMDFDPAGDPSEREPGAAAGREQGSLIPLAAAR